VVLTGAGGYVAQRMIRPLQERYACHWSEEEFVP